MKKLAAVLLILAIFSMYVVTPIHASQLADISADEGYLLEPDRVAAIDALYAQRSELALNIEENRDAILQIDARLEALGVEEISSEELATKLGENLASPMASYPATNSSTKWTSLRTIYVYQGRQYEVQRVTGVPNIPEETTGIVDHENYTLTSIVYAGINKHHGVEYANEELIRFTTKNALEYVAQGTLDTITSAFPAVSTACSLFSDGLDFLQKTIDGTIIYADALNGTTTFSDVSYITSVSMIATEVYLFVKIPGYADEGAQIYAYSGNQIECTVSIFGTALWAENGELTPINLTASDNFVIRSAYYGNHYERAVKTFVEYKQGLTTKETYILHRVDLEFYGDLTSEYESIHNGNFVQSSDKVVLTVDVPTDLGGLYYT